MFKWIYQMGAAHENERIRRLIAEFTVQANIEMGQLDIYLQDRKSMKLDSDKRLSELHRAKEIIDKLLRPVLLGQRDFGPAPIDRETKK